MTRLVLLIYFNNVYLHLGWKNKNSFSIHHTSNKHLMLSKNIFHLVTPFCNSSLDLYCHFLSQKRYLKERGNIFLRKVNGTI
jgi:hypothetical protein